MGNKTSKHTSRTQSMESSILETMLQDHCVIPICLPMDFLEGITGNFAKEQELGKGAFGVVYKGVLNDGQAIAVKKLLKTNLLEDEEFHKEVTCLIGFKHENIVKLLGYCAESRMEVTQVGGRYVMAEAPKSRLLCFEYINNNSLDHHLSAESDGLDWHVRYEIIRGICRGLHYLHTECHIVHLDLKPQNILLDYNMVPKIGDFGMSRLFGEQQSRIITKSPVGTLGYMAPEYTINGLISEKADIFSLGVIIIQLMTGCRSYPITEESFKHFVESVVGKWRNRLLNEEAMYVPLENYVQQVRECILIGLKCVDPDPNKRPAALAIIEKLNEIDSTPPEDQEPTSSVSSDANTPNNSWKEVTRNLVAAGFNKEAPRIAFYTAMYVARKNRL